MEKWSAHGDDEEYVKRIRFNNMQDLVTMSGGLCYKRINWKIMKCMLALSGRDNIAPSSCIQYINS